MQLQLLAKHMEQKRDYETPKYASNPYMTKWIELNTNAVGQALHKVTARLSELESVREIWENKCDWSRPTPSLWHWIRRIGGISVSWTRSPSA